MTDRRLLSLLAISSFTAIMAACAIGSTPMAPGAFLAALFGTGAPSEMIVLWEIRFPRAIAAFLVGAALGISGAGLQGLLRNPLAEPGVLGVSASAALGASLVLFYGGANIGAVSVPIAAIVGALSATFALVIAAMRTQSITTLILIGVGLSSFAGAIMALLLNLAPNPFSLADLMSWTLGSVANRSISDLFMPAPFIFIGAGLIMMAGRALSALALGEDAAYGMGVDLKRTRLLVVVGAGFATGGAVAIAGAIGFVGIVAAHIIRPFVGHDPARSLAPSALLGGVILTAADITVRLLPTPAELRLGVVAALIGAPIFILIAAQRGGRR